jgi:hypothetical protein
MNIIDGRIVGLLNASILISASVYEKETII